MSDNGIKRQHGFFIIGFILVILSSVIIGVFHIGVLYFFGIPLFALLAGIILVWIGRASLRAKMIASTASIPLVISAFALSMYIGSAEPETFLIPENYRGEIVVFYEEPCGKEPEVENGRRLYRLSENGVLITKFGRNKGYLDQNFFLVNDEGGREKIPLFRRQKFETEKEEFGDRRMVSGELTKETVGAFYAYGAETHYVSPNSLNFIISDYRYYDRDPKERLRDSKTFNEFAKLALHACRESDNFPATVAP